VKHTYELLPLSNLNTILIHYIGDENTAVDYAHGNAKSESSINIVKSKERMQNKYSFKSQITQIMVLTLNSLKI